MSHLKGKVCIVTGSTSGIGLVTAKEMAKMGATTIVVARDKARGKKAVAKVIAYSGNHNVDLLMCDFASQSSIVEFTKTFKEKHKRLDILVNNAGLMSSKRQETDLDIEMTFAVNHLGYFITTNLFKDILTQTPMSRVVIVSSDLHFHGNINPNNLMHEHDYDAFIAYSDSKLANVLFTYKMADILEGSSTTINVVHPGIIKTKFGIEDRNSEKTFPMGRISPKDGAKALLYLSISPKVQGISGKYFNMMQMEQSSALSYDKYLSDVLWQKSLEYSTVLTKK